MTVDLVGIIQTVGFPIAVVVWLLYERYTSQKEMGQIIQANTMVIQKLVDVLDAKKEEN